MGGGYATETKKRKWVARRRKGERGEKMTDGQDRRKKIGRRKGIKGKMIKKKGNRRKLNLERLRKREGCHYSSQGNQRGFLPIQSIKPPSPSLFPFKCPFPSFPLPCKPFLIITSTSASLGFYAVSRGVDQREGGFSG